MNQYGSRAQTYWQTNLPDQYAQIADPATFFTDLGDQMAAQIDEMTDQIAGRDPAGENFMTKLGRLNEARLAAEDEVLRQTLPLDSETTTSA